MAVLNSVEPAVAVSAEKEEFVATSWEGKEKDELLEDFKGKGKPSLKKTAIWKKRREGMGLGDPAITSRH